MIGEGTGRTRRSAAWSGARIAGVLRAAILAVAGMASVMLGGAADAQFFRPYFVNVTTTLTQGGTFTTGGWLHGAHGIAFTDIDGDGDTDVFVSRVLSLDSTVLADELYVNQGGFVFTEESALRGIAPLDGDGHAAVFVDVDADGDVDLFKGDTNGTNELYLNDGRGFFALSTIAGMRATINPPMNYGTRGVGAGDFDGDGDIDLFAANHGQSNELYINRGDGTFSEDARLRGVEDRVGNAVQTQGCAVADYDGDGDLDIFLAKRVGPNRLYQNDGNGVFTDVADWAGVQMLTTECEGATFGDLDNDGDLDLVVAKTRGVWHGVFRNNGDGTFTDESLVHKLFNEFAYNILLEDVDLDGDLDIVIPFNKRGFRTYLNDGTGRFTAFPDPGYGYVGRDIRCAAFTDLDADGDHDLIVVDKRSFNRLYENDGRLVAGAHWLEVAVKGPRGEVAAPGARVEVFPSGQLGNAAMRLQTRWTGGTGMGYCRQQHANARFGLAAGTYDVRATLPSGEVVDRRAVSVDQRITLDPSPPAPVVPGERTPTGSIFGR